MYLPSLDPETLFCIILCFSQKKSDGLKKKSRYRLSSSEHVQRQKLRKCRTLATSPPSEPFTAERVCSGIIPSQSSVRQGWWGGLLFADSHWEPEPNHDEGGHHSCQQSSQEGPSQWVSQCLSDQVLTAHLGPRHSPTALTRLFSVFSSK